MSSQAPSGRLSLKLLEEEIKMAARTQVAAKERAAVNEARRSDGVKRYGFGEMQANAGRMRS